METDNKGILEQANLAVTRGDYERFLDFCTDDVRWTFVGDRVIVGKDEIMKYMNATYLEPPKFDVKNLIAENDFVIAVGEISLTGEDKKTIVYTYCDVWKFRGGKMAELMAFVIENK